MGRGCISTAVNLYRQTPGRCRGLSCMFMWSARGPPCEHHQMGPVPSVCGARCRRRRRRRAGWPPWACSALGYQAALGGVAI